MDNTIKKLSELYQDYGPVLLSYLRRQFGTVESPEDLLHETFVNALQSFESLKKIDSQKAWLFTIANRVGLTACRRKRLTQPLTENIPTQKTVESDPRLKTIRHAISKLPTQQRETLELRLKDQLTYQEISQVLKIPIGTVRSRIHNAIRNIRRMLLNNSNLGNF